MSNFPPPDVTVFELPYDPEASEQYFILKLVRSGAITPVPPPVAPGALGIDISHWQSDNKPIDWPLLYAEGRPAFVFMKATDGISFSDSWLARHREGARSEDLPYGFYHYMQAGDGRAQADYFLNSLGGDAGHLPLACDVEENTIRLRDVRAFVDRIHEEVPGHPVAIYTRASLWSEIGGDNPNLPEFGDCLCWVSHPGAAKPILPSDWTAYDFWQVTWKGRIPGISANVDVNVFKGLAAKPWWVRDCPFNALPAINLAPVTLYKSPHGIIDRTMNINWLSKVTAYALDGWLKVADNPPLWAEAKHFKVAL